MARGVNKFLAKGLANEQEQLEQAKAASKAKKNIPSDESTQYPEVIQISEPSQKESSSKSKNKGGRPTNIERGVKSRRQYTLTLKEDDYKRFYDIASEEDISFAKFMEKAAKEYIENHGL